MEHPELPPNHEPASIVKKLWFGFFILMYPVLITFSLVFTGLLWFFSALSRLFSKLVELFSRDNKPVGGRSQAPDNLEGVHPAEGTTGPLE